MSLEQQLQSRSGSVCELCSSAESLAPYHVPPEARGVGLDQHVLLCETCRSQVTKDVAMDSNHWRCLNDSMWSQVPAVQVVAWRMLNRIKSEGWPQDLLDMLYLDDELSLWAQATGEGLAEEDQIRHIDSNGVQLQAGDTVVLIKDLTVKGANFTAKRGTAVRNISLVPDNAEQIEGRVNGQHIVILTKFAKKSA